jgi:hypothetical protein
MILRYNKPNLAKIVIYKISQITPYLGYVDEIFNIQGQLNPGISGQKTKSHPVPIH